MRFIPTKVHGFIDYPLGLFLIAAPWLFGFVDQSDAAMWISVLAGIAVLLMSMLTDYELGVMRMLPMKLHNAVDVLVGAFFVIAPWLFGFADTGANAWLVFVVVGLSAIAAGALTKNSPEHPVVHEKPTA